MEAYTSQPPASDPVTPSHGLRVLERFNADQSVVGVRSDVRSEPRTQDPAKRLLCAGCANPITSIDQKSQMAGAHEHTFANPHGLVYRIGCYGAAPGCMGIGRESTEFPWFAGYAWTVQVCGRCALHVGWKFRSAERAFWGLIADRLVEEPSRPEHD